MDTVQFRRMQIHQLIETIQGNPKGFSSEEGRLQYLGKDVVMVGDQVRFTGDLSKELTTDGLTDQQAEQDTPCSLDSKMLYERVVNLSPEIKNRLPTSRNEQLRVVAEESVANETIIQAIYSARTAPLQIAIYDLLLERGDDTQIETAVHATKYLKEMEDSEKYLLLSSLQRAYKKPFYRHMLEHIILNDVSLMFQLYREARILENGPLSMETLSVYFPLFTTEIEGVPAEACLTDIAHLIEQLQPQHQSVFRFELDKLTKQLSAGSAPGHTAIDEQKHDVSHSIRTLFFLLAVFACDAERGIPEQAVHLVTAIMKHRNRSNIPILKRVLTNFMWCKPSVKQEICKARSGGEHLLLAPLALVTMSLNGDITDDQLLQACADFQKGGSLRRAMKDGKVFHQWLVTTRALTHSSEIDSDLKGKIICKLTGNTQDIYFKLSVLQATIAARGQPDKPLALLGIQTGSTKEIIELVLDRGKQAVKSDNDTIRWLSERRYFHLLPLYVGNIENARETTLALQEKNEIIDLITQSMEASARGEFVAFRNDAGENPHLQQIYKSRPDLEVGWKANFRGFSDSLSQHLNRGETMVLSEDAWDLFISGVEVFTCQAPDERPEFNRSLAGYVADGRNAMLLLKKNTGTVLNRAVVRTLIGEDWSPVLFLETVYPATSSHLRKSLFLDAALELAQQLKLELYIGGAYSSDQKQSRLTVLEGRAPYDYFDQLGNYACKRGVHTFYGVRVTPHHS